MKKIVFIVCLCVHNVYGAAGVVPETYFRFAVDPYNALPGAIALVAGARLNDTRHKILSALSLATGMYQLYKSITIRTNIHALATLFPQDQEEVELKTGTTTTRYTIH